MEYFYKYKFIIKKIKFPKFVSIIRIYYIQENHKVYLQNILFNKETITI